jgi:hypothetical protein
LPVGLSNLHRIAKTKPIKVLVKELVKAGADRVTAVKGIIVKTQDFLMILPFLGV